MDDEAGERTIAQVEADAQAMVDELERLVAQLRLARAESGGEHAAVPPPLPPLPRPRRARLVTVLGLAAVALVGIVGAAAVTAARDVSASAEGPGGMEPIPYSRTAPETSGSSGAEGTAVPLGSTTPVAAAGPSRPGPLAGSATASGAAADGEGGWARQERSAMRGLPAPAELDLFNSRLQARLLKQAAEQAAEQAEQQTEELQALARSFEPTAPVPQLPPFGEGGGR